MYRLFASDMDGTLLNRYSKVAPATTAAVEAANKTGRIFTVVTGRSLFGMRQFAPALPLQHPFGIFNGAMIVDMSGKIYYEQPMIVDMSGKIYYEQPLTREDAAEILQLAHERTENVYLWVGQDMYGYRIDEKLQRYAAMSGVSPKIIESDEQILEMPIAKILWHDTPANIASWLAALSKSLAGRVNVSTSAPDYIEFNHADVSKGLCLQRLGELMDVSREEIIAVGDETNDLPMIRYAGLGIAMKNATQAVLEEADLVSPWTNDEDGLAKLIDRYLL